jgi:hypothetical protein
VGQFCVIYELGDKKNQFHVSCPYIYNNYSHHIVRPDGRGNMRCHDLVIYGK